MEPFEAKKIAIRLDIQAKRQENDGSAVETTSAAVAVPVPGSQEALQERPSMSYSEVLEATDVNFDFDFDFNMDWTSEAADGFHD